MQLLLSADFYESIEQMMKKVVRKRVKAKAKVCTCVRKDCNEPRKVGARGLCKHHWNQFDYGRRLAKARGITVLKRYERLEIAAGRVLRGNRGSRQGNDYKHRATA